MSEFDSLRPVLREWKAPEPSAALDQRVRAAYRAFAAPSPWRRFWSARVSVPIPLLAAALLLFAVAWLVDHRPVPADRAPGVVTRLASTGFQPLPDGTARVEEVRP